MNPSYEKAQKIKTPDERTLESLDEDEKYFIVREDMPKLLLSQEQKENLKKAAAVVETSLTIGFALTLILQLSLKGVMSELWNTFNTLQILIALTQMSIIVPSNIQLVNEILD